MKAKIFAIFATIFLASSAVNTAYQNWEWGHKCDGIEITTHCTGDDGERYNKYIFHEALAEDRTIVVHHDAVAEKSHIVHHPATPAKTHTVYHPDEIGVRVIRRCIRTTISYKNGTCARSQCRDGEYSGSSGRGTCSYHGGVLRSGGPWYEYITETYVKKKAWIETVVDVPAKKAWDEKVIDIQAKAAWDETVILEKAHAAYYEKELLKP